MWNYWSVGKKVSGSHWFEISWLQRPTRCCTENLPVITLVASKLLWLLSAWKMQTCLRALKLLHKTVKLKKKKQEWSSSISEKVDFWSKTAFNLNANILRFWFNQQFFQFHYSSESKWWVFGQMQQSAGWDVPAFSGNTLHEHFSLDSTSGSEYECTKTACKKWKRCFTPWNFEQADHWWLRRIFSEENFWHAWSTSAAFSLHHRRKHKQSRRRVKGSTPESIACQHMHRNTHTHIWTCICLSQQGPCSEAA